MYIQNRRNNQMVIKDKNIYKRWTYMIQDNTLYIKNVTNNQMMFKDNNVSETYKKGGHL